jgi:threonylcarbamoyladenosine tRNA methylthiotransferase MtaB
MPHLHLSLQAGDDMILKRMKRRHLSADAVRFCQEARRLRPDIVFGADLIAGFPTETDEMFANSLAHVDDCGLTYLHVFPFSPRKGTPAARMPQVAKPQVKARAAQLRARGDAMLAAYFDQQTGVETEILMERANMGRTPQFAEVELADADATTTVIGGFRRVRIAGRADHRLLGAAIS